ncbi:MAG: hypothetical protein AAFU64_10940, partial [Bacteroidota bacterium]
IKKKNLYEPWYSKKGKFNVNQLLDFHYDWLRANPSLLIMEEWQEMEETWQLALLLTYINEIKDRRKGEKSTPLIISQDQENGLIEGLSGELYDEPNGRAALQMICGSLEMVQIS